MALKRYKPGSVALLGANFTDENGVAADPDVSVRVRIIDETGAVIVDLTELIGGLSLIENPVVGRFQYRYTVTTNDSTEQHMWQHEWTGNSLAPALTVVDDDCFLVEATDFP